MGEQKKYSVLAVLIGWLASMAMSYAVSFGINYFFIRNNNSHNFQLAQIVTIIAVLSWAIFALLYVIAGYITGAIAPANEVQHAVWVGILLVITSVVRTMIAIIAVPSRIPLAALIHPTRIIVVALTIPLVALGGYLASGKSRNQHRNQY